MMSPASDYKDKYSHFIGKGAAKDAAHMLQANKTYGCVPVANKRDMWSIEEAMNEIRAKKRLQQSGEELPTTSEASHPTPFDLQHGRGIEEQGCCYQDPS
ncbi:sperm-associated antigen 7 [Sigmodon hispidus]